MEKWNTVSQFEASSGNLKGPITFWAKKTFSNQPFELGKKVAYKRIHMLELILNNPSWTIWRIFTHGSYFVFSAMTLNSWTEDSLFLAKYESISRVVGINIRWNVRNVSLQASLSRSVSSAPFCYFFQILSLLLLVQPRTSFSLFFLQAYNFYNFHLV